MPLSLMSSEQLTLTPNESSQLEVVSHNVDLPGMLFMIH